MAVDYFQPETFQQANPLLSGVQAGQQIFQQGVQNAYLPQSMAAQIGLLKAQTGLAGAQTQYFPMTAMAQYLRGAGTYERAIGQNSPVSVIASLQNNPAYQTLVANNPALAKQISDLMVQGSLYGRGATIPGGMQMPGIPGMPGNAGNIGMPQGNGMPGNVSQGPIQQGMQPSQLPPATPMPSAPPGGTPLPANLPSIQSTGQMPMTPQQQRTVDALRQNLQQNGQQPGTQNSPPTIGQNSQNSLLQPQDYQNFSNALQSEALKKTTTTQVLNQRQYSQILDPLLAQGAQLMPSVAKYAGLKGRVELAYDASKAALGYNSPDYTNYQVFTNTVAPNIANELRRVLGGQATDTELKNMDSLADPNYWHSNPDLAMTQYKALVDLYQNTVNPALAKSTAQVQQNLQQGATQNQNVPVTALSTNAPQASKTLNGKTYAKINGKWYQQ